MQLIQLGKHIYIGFIFNLESLLFHYLFDLLGCSFFFCNLIRPWKSLMTAVLTLAKVLLHSLRRRIYRKRDGDIVSNLVNYYLWRMHISMFGLEAKTEALDFDSVPLEELKLLYINLDIILNPACNYLSSWISPIWIRTNIIIWKWTRYHHTNVLFKHYILCHKYIIFLRISWCTI